MNRLILTISIIVYALSGYSQEDCKPVINRPPESVTANKTQIITQAKADISFVIKQADLKFLTSMTLVEPQSREEHFIKAFEDYQKKAKLSYETGNKLLEVDPPFRVKSSFDANAKDNQAPLDNCIAIGANDYLISVTNGFIECWKDNKREFRKSYYEFTGGNFPSSCDPKVIYDPEEKRFIIFVQRQDNNYDATEFLLAFSKTENPLNGWNFYRLKGNPLNHTNHWFDFPKLGISKDGLFISGNIIAAADSFSQTMVYQVDKSRGFRGDSLKYIVWYDIPGRPYTIQPVNDAYGRLCDRGIYMVGTYFRHNSNVVYLYDITGSIYDAATRINVYNILVTPYRFFAKAVQGKNSLPISTGDTRIQDAIYDKGKIVYVFTSGDNRNFSRINFNILDVATLSNRNTLLGDLNNYSYGFPSLHVFSEKDEPSQYVVLYNATGRDSFPGIRCKLCDAKLNCSQEVVLNKGYDLTGPAWGDYTSVAKNFGRRNDLWLAASYGKIPGTRQTMLCNIVRSKELAPAVNDANDRYVDFNAPVTDTVKVVVKDENGKEEVAYNNLVQKGNNVLNISTTGITGKSYTIQFFSKNDSSIHQKVFTRD